MRAQRGRTLVVISESGKSYRKGMELRLQPALAIHLHRASAGTPPMSEPSPLPAPTASMSSTSSAATALAGPDLLRLRRNQGRTPPRLRPHVHAPATSRLTPFFLFAHLSHRHRGFLYHRYMLYQGPRHHNQVLRPPRPNTTTPLHSDPFPNYRPVAKIQGSDNILPPGFEGTQTSCQFEIKPSQIPIIKQITPLKIVLNRTL